MNPRYLGIYPIHMPFEQDENVWDRCDLTVICCDVNERRFTSSKWCDKNLVLYIFR